MATILSVVIPMYNEVETIERLLDHVVDADLSDLGVHREILVVDDGSNDGSDAAVEAWMAQHPLTEPDRIFLVRQTNQGKGAAVRAGVKQSTGDIVIVQDADLEYDPADFRQCITPILGGAACVVYGSRQLEPANRRHSGVGFYLGGLTVTAFVNFLFGSQLTDEPTCYKTFRGDLIRSLPYESDDFDWEPEVTAKILRLGIDVHEVPISYDPRPISEGKKIRWRDGASALWTALQWRLRPLGAIRGDLAAAGTASRPPPPWYCGPLGAVALALVLRLGLWSVGWDDPQTAFFRPDSWDYVHSAQALAADGSYSLSPESAEPATRRPPGFSALLAVLMTLSGGGLLLPAAVLCLLSALTCLPVYGAALNLAGTLGTRARPAAVLASLLFAVSLTSVAHAPLFLSDTSFALLVALQLWFFARFQARGQVPDLAAAALCNALAVLLRPIALAWVVPGTVLILLASTHRAPRRWARGLLCVVGFAAITAVVVAPWMWRNHRLGAGFTVDTNTGSTLYYYNAVALESVVTGEPEVAVRARFEERERLAFEATPERDATVRQREAYRVSQALHEFARHPWTYARLHLQPAILLPDAPTFFESLGLTRTRRGTLDVLLRRGFGPALRNYFGDRLSLVWWLAPALAVVAITYAGYLLQLWLWVRRRDLDALLLGAAFFLYYLVLPGPIAMPRYLLPALPLICVGAGLGLTWLWIRFRPPADPLPSP